MYKRQDEHRCSEQASDPTSNCTDVSMINSSDKRDEETLVTSSAEGMKSSLTLAKDDLGETTQSSKAGNHREATIISDCTADIMAQEKTTNTSVTCVPSQFTESAIAVTTTPTLPTSSAAGIVTSASGVGQQSPERRRSATVITLRSAASCGSDSMTNRIQANQTMSTLPCSELRNPWVINLKEARIRPNFNSFEGEKVFRKGTATTRMVLPGFARSQQDFMTSYDSGLHTETLQRLKTTSNKCPSELLNRHSAFTSPIYDTVYEEHPTSICKSTTELVENRSQSIAAQQTDNIGKSYSLEDPKVRAGTRQTSTGSGDTAISGRARALEHAIDDHELRNCTEYVVHGQNDCCSAPSTSSKPVKSVTFRDDVDCVSVQRRLESAQDFSNMETSMDGKDNTNFSAGLSGASVPLPVRTCVADDVKANRCAKTTKSSSLPLCGRSTVYPDSVNLRDNVSVLRDTITSCDLEELPKYLADMYRQQKLERKREQELAAKDRERLEDIDKMWKDFESQLTIPVSVASSSTGTATAEPTEDSVANSSNAQTMQKKKPRQRVLVSSFNYLVYYVGSLLNGFCDYQSI